MHSAHSKCSVHPAFPKVFIQISLSKIQNFIVKNSKISLSHDFHCLAWIRYYSYFFFLSTESQKDFFKHFLERNNGDISIQKRDKNTSIPNCTVNCCLRWKKTYFSDLLRVFIQSRTRIVFIHSSVDWIS